MSIRSLKLLENGLQVFQALALLITAIVLLVQGTKQPPWPFILCTAVAIEIVILIRYVPRLVAAYKSQD